ncbi:MAG: polyprenyl diphosphate synthase [Candidatus Peribacteraceae bacterium]|jgi:undecaprenyl diphosphate synthase
MPDSPPPLHIAIIPDGNRRWARAKGLLAWNGHQKAIENFKDLTECCYDDPRIGTLTVWCFSTENWKRDPQEIGKLMNMLEEYLQKERKGFAEKQTRFLHSGRTDRLPPSLVTLMRDVMEETKNFNRFTLHLAVDYGGKDEIIRALRKAKNPSSLSEESFRSLFDQPSLPDIDLVIRTSGEMRTSNFFLWQTAYAEWEFVDKFFPDFTAKDLMNAVDAFEKRTRRFGT